MLFVTTFLCYDEAALFFYAALLSLMFDLLISQLADAKSKVSKSETELTTLQAELLESRQFSDHQASMFKCCPFAKILVV